MTRFSSKIRLRIENRAKNRCEYCKMTQGFFNFHVDHIIPIIHNGTDNLNNLAWSCSWCNSHKSSNIGSYLTRSDILSRHITPLYNPRIDRWNEHFGINSLEISAQTAIGQITIDLFGFNHPTLLEIREFLIHQGLF